MPRRLGRAVCRALARGGGAPDPPAATTHAVSFQWVISLSGSLSGRPPSVDCTHAWPQLGISTEIRPSALVRSEGHEELRHTVLDRHSEQLFTGMRPLPATRGDRFSFVWEISGWSVRWG